MRISQGFVIEFQGDRLGSPAAFPDLAGLLIPNHLHWLPPHPPGRAEDGPGSMSSTVVTLKVGIG